MPIGRRLIVAVGLVVAFGIPSIVLAQAGRSTINVTANYTGSYTPPGGSRLQLQLIDVSNNLVLVDNTWDVGGVRPPYTELLSITSSRLNSSRNYNVVAQLFEANRTVKYRGQSRLGFANNAPSPVTIAMTAQSGTVGQYGSGSARILIGVLLGLAALGLAALYWLRTHGASQRLA
jgi:hypothetical protein